MNHRADQDSVVAHGNNITAYQDKHRNAKFNWNKDEGRHSFKSDHCFAEDWNSTFSYFHLNDQLCKCVGTVIVSLKKRFHVKGNKLCLPNLRK